MKRIDRIYRDAHKVAKGRRETKDINAEMKEIEDYIAYRKTHPMTPEEVRRNQQFIKEMRERYS